MSFDAGETPFSKDPALAVQGYWISSSPENPCDWVLNSQCFAFAHIVGRHTGAKLADLLLSRIRRIGLQSKQLGWFVGDNAEVTDVVVRKIGQHIVRNLGSEADPGWSRGSKQRRGRSVT
jgi:hypothetical protein